MMILQFLNNKSSDSKEDLLLIKPKRKWIHWVVYFSCAYLTFVPLIVTFLWMNYRIKDVKDHVDEWDYLLFTQQYPITTCIWMEEANGIRSCRLPMNKYAWSIHGIWPTQNGTEGPFFCKNLPFNVSALEPILPDLQESWPSTGNQGNIAFWKHEWTKHGTCAVEDPIFDSELTYFKQGLDWHKDWNLTSILNNANITPSDSKSYNYTDFYENVKNALGFAPYISCYHDKKREVSLISEVRYCVTKNLNLMDCNLYFEEQTCPETGIYYPATSSF